MFENIKVYVEEYLSFRLSKNLSTHNLIDFTYNISASRWRFTLAETRILTSYKPNNGIVTNN